MKGLILLDNVSLLPNAVRKELDSVEHLVVPCIAIKEGVLNNILYTSKELEAFAETWNGVPVPVDHPINDRGVHVTANSTLCEETVNIGRFYNVEFIDDAIKGEIWINIEKAEKLGHKELVESLESGEIVEVSTGLFGNHEKEEGEFDGVPYSYVINGIIPDHLALLPNDVGACSIKDGCGAMRVNKDKIPCSECARKEREGFWNKVKRLFKVNETSHSEINEALYKTLKKKHGKNWYGYILDTFDSYFIYEHEQKLYKQSFSIDGDTKEATLVGDVIEVRLERKYVPVSAEMQTNEINTMTEKKKNALVNALALALAANAEDVTDDCRAKVANLSEPMLVNLAKDKGLDFDDEGNKVEVNKQELKPVAKPPCQKVETNKEGSLSEDDKALLERLKANEATRLKAKRDKVVEINKNLTPEMVDKMDEATLDAMLTNSGESVDFSLAGAEPVTNKEDEMPERPSVLLGNGESE